MELVPATLSRAASVTGSPQLDRASAVYSSVLAINNPCAEFLTFPTPRLILPWNAIQVNYSFKPKIIDIF